MLTLVLVRRRLVLALDSLGSVQNEALNDSKHAKHSWMSDVHNTAIHKPVYLFESSRILEAQEAYLTTRMGGRISVVRFKMSGLFEVSLAKVASVGN